MTRSHQPTFAAGEVSNAVNARVDLEKFGSGLSATRNLVLHPQGGVSNRAGLRFGGRTRNNRAGRLIPFVYDAETNQAFVLEFGDYRMRVYNLGAPVVEDGKPVTGMTTASPAVFTVAGHGYSTGDEVVLSGLSAPTNFNNRNFKVVVVSADTISLTDLDGVAVSSSALAAYGSGGVFSRLYEAATPYALADLRKLVFAQENDVVYFAHRKYPPYKLARYGTRNWQFLPLVTTPAIAAPEGLSVHSVHSLKDGSTASIAFAVTAVGGDGAESDKTADVSVSVQHENADGRVIRFSWTAVSGAVSYRVYRTVGSGKTGLIVDTPLTEVEVPQTAVYGDGSAVPSSADSGAPATPTGFAAEVLFGAELFYAVAAVSDSTGEESLLSAEAMVRNDLRFAGNKSYLQWQFVPGAAFYRIYRKLNGVFGFIGLASSTSFIDENITPDISDGPQTAFDPFDATGNYPGAVTFFEQRLAYGGTDLNPSGVWLGQSSNYENFGSSSPVKPNDAITFRIRSAEKNDIRALVPSRGLGVFTSAAEWMVYPGSDDFLTPSNPVPKRQTRRGSAFLQPVVIGEAILYYQARGSVVRDMAYQFSEDTFSGPDLTILARHLFDGRTVVAWAYAQAPDSVLWCVLDDGEALALTYMREQGVWGWTRHETDGLFLDVAVVAENNADIPYFIVSRSIGGNTVHHVERLDPRQFTQVADAFFVDSGLSYSGAAVPSVSGLWHLEGREVVALCDGNVIEGLTVENGSVALGRAYSTIHVGLSYTSVLVTLNLDLGQVKGLGTVQGRQKSVSEVTIRVEDTRGVHVGLGDYSRTDTGKKQMFEQKQLGGMWNEPPGLVTGDVRVTTPWDWNDSGRIAVKQFYPLPMTVLAVMPEIAIAR